MKRRSLALALVSPGLLWAQAGPPAPDPHNPRWLRLRAHLFGDQEPGTDPGLQLLAPLRAIDAGAVPITLTAQASAQRGAVRKLYLLVDQNPTPVAAEFEFSTQALAFVATHVRIDSYSHLRAIAQYADGSYAMVRQFIKAVGGCSAPPLSEAVQVPLGQISLKQAQAEGTTRAHLVIQHHNHNGLQMDPLTRLTPPAHFLRQFSVQRAGELLLRAELDFAISEPPHFELRWQTQTGPITVQAADSKDLQFETHFA